VYAMVIDFQQTYRNFRNKKMGRKKM